MWWEQLTFRNPAQRRGAVLSNFAADVEVLEDRCFLSAVPGANQVVLPGEGFHSIQFSPSGQLSDLIWLEATDQLVYRVRDAAGHWSQEVVFQRSFAPGFYNIRDFEGAQLLHTSDGTPHVLLVADGQGAVIQHLARTASGWELVETIDVSPRTISSRTLRAAVGPHDSFHVMAYHEDSFGSGNGHYFHGTNTTGQWVFETVVPAGDPYGFFQSSYAPRFLSLAVDSQNAAHFVFVPEFSNIPNPDGTTRVFSQLNYASNRGGSWFVLPVDAPPDGTGDAGLGASLAIGPGDLVAIANFFVERVDSGSPAHSHLAYHELLPGHTFSRVIVASQPDGYVAGDGPFFTGFAPHLVFDSLGRPNIIFSDHAAQHFEFFGADEFAGQIRRAVRTWGQWRLETLFPQVHPLENQIVFPSVALSPTEIAITALVRQDLLNPDLTIAQTDHFHLTFSRPFDMNPQQLIVTGADAGGGPHVRLLNGVTGQAVVDVFPYDLSFTGGVRVALGDVNQDGFPDVITAPGAGGGPHVRVFDGRTGTLLRDLFVYNPQFFGGVYLTSTDMNGDGFADLITSPGPGGGPHVRVLNGQTGQALLDVFAYEGFLGGVRVAAGDINGDGTPDLITAPGPGGGPHIRVFNGQTGELIREFFAYDPAFLGGVYVAAADFNGDGRTEIVTGTGSGGGPHVRVFDGMTGSLLHEFFAYDPGFLGGVRVSTGDTNGDGLLDLITVPGPGGGPHVRTFDGATGNPLAQFFAYDSGFFGGVLLGGWADQPVVGSSANFTISRSTALNEANLESGSLRARGPNTNPPRILTSLLLENPGSLVFSDEALRNRGRPGASSAPLSSAPPSPRPIAEESSPLPPPLQAFDQEDRQLAHEFFSDEDFLDNLLTEALA